jgi:23S rRNA (uracil1939-C5)-methyltransferase
MKAEIQKIVYPGKSFASHNGKVLFADEGLPGEIIEVKTTKEKKGYIEAATLNIVKTSDKRVKPLCDHYKACSPYQYIDYNFQLELKKLQIEEIFARVLGVKLSGFKVKPSEKIWGYRNKLRLHMIHRNGVSTLAYHMPETHDKFVPVDKCHLASGNVNNLFSFLADTASKRKLSFIEELEIRENIAGKLLVTVYGKTAENHKNNREWADEIAGRFPLEGIVYISRQTPEETLIHGKNYIEEKINDKIFRIGAQSFFQINISALNSLVAEMLETIERRSFRIAADLYCGIGTFGIIFADKSEKMIGVEIAEENIRFLSQNLKSNHINNYILYQGLSEKLTQQVLKEKIDALIVDPPRKGIGKDVCEILLKGKPRHIFYVSCDPVTLARDLKILLQKYNLAGISGYDFFPHTPHIETFCVLDRK